jgi:hypothetical protein
MCRSFGRRASRDQFSSVSKRWLKIGHISSMSHNRCYFPRKGERERYFWVTYQGHEIDDGIDRNLRKTHPSSQDDASPLVAALYFLLFVHSWETSSNSILFALICLFSNLIHLVHTYQKVGALLHRDFWKIFRLCLESNFPRIVLSTELKSLPPAKCLSITYTDSIVVDSHPFERETFRVLNRLLRGYPELYNPSVSGKTSSCHSCWYKRFYEIKTSMHNQSHSEIAESYLEYRLFLSRLSVECIANETHNCSGFLICFLFVYSLLTSYDELAVGIHATRSRGSTDQDYIWGKR